MRNDKGEGVNQRAILIELETALDLGATKTARKIGTNYNTYKQWKSGRRNMCGTTLKLIELILVICENDLKRKLLD